ncbi:MAG: prolipoprotein diacylglyceryl transferase [Epsilonproteobacteria bacterium]|nr:prolipoprotein diacylglyceryl transferase [Campylobacterota bacterium]
MINNIDPIAISIGGVQIHWYGIFFALGLLFAYLLGEWIFKRENKNPKLLESFFIYLIIGITIGARAFHIIFYDLDYFLAHPVEIFYVWRGGLASHGGVIGAIVAIYLFCKRYKIDFLWMLSRAALATLIVVTFIRVGNFFNSEIVGLPTDSALGVIFLKVDNLKRHPVVLYEALGYFFIFLLSLWLYIKLPFERFTQIGFALILTLAFSIRFLLEYFKTPQSEFANILPLSMGQILSIPFIIFGVVWLIRAKKELNS